MGVLIGLYIFIGLVVFILSVLALDDPQTKRNQKIIGWIGLSAPVWPITALVAVVLFFLITVRNLLLAVRGRWQ